MKTFTKEYVLAHTENIQNYDSFGRNLTLSILQAAAAKLEKGEAKDGRVELQAAFYVSPNQGRECVTLVFQPLPTLPGHCAQPPLTLHVGNI